MTPDILVNDFARVGPHRIVQQAPHQYPLLPPGDSFHMITRHANCAMLDTGVLPMVSSGFATNQLTSPPDVYFPGTKHVRGV